jgi:hypothetical protein
MFLTGLLSLLFVAAAVQGAPVKKSMACNGRPEYCQRKFSEVTFMGAHDSFATSTNPFALSRDRRISLSDQLSMGIRLLQGQGHAQDGTVHLCHTSCMLFDGGSMQDYLAAVKTFLDANLNEVVTLLFTNPEELSIEHYWHPAFVASGIAELAFVPASSPVLSEEWPTLQHLIMSGKRVVVFMDKGANSATVPYILSEFEHIWESPYSVTDPTFPCKLDRIAGNLVPEQHMYLVNHSLNMALKLPFAPPIIVPNVFRASTTNGIESILRHADACRSIPESGGRAPNFVLLDWVDSGQVIEAGERLNGF